jgi:hypothetical protein
MSNQSRSRRLRAALVVAGSVAAIGASGCGSSRHADPQAQSTTPAAFNSAGANPLAVPPVTDTALEHGSAPSQITKTIVAFYRAAWQDNATQACSLFSPAGVAGFMHAAETSFPQSVNGQSTCEHAMEIYNASLGDSASTTEENDPSFSPNAIANVGVADVQIAGATATAIAPTNVTDLINPEQFHLVRAHDHWLIDGSSSLNASNLPKILAEAKAKGELRPKKQSR